MSRLPPSPTIAEPTLALGHGSMAPCCRRERSPHALAAAGNSCPVAPPRRGDPLSPLIRLAGAIAVPDGGGASRVPLPGGIVMFDGGPLCPVYGSDPPLHV